MSLTQHAFARHATLLSFATLVCSAGSSVLAQAPDPIESARFAVRVSLVGPTFATVNATSPIAVGPDLLLLDQDGALIRRDALGRSHFLLTSAGVPPGLSPIDEQFLNVAANDAGDRIYLVITSSITPAGVPVVVSPRGNHTGYQVLFEFAYDGVALTQPRGIVSFETYTDGHTGGGLLVLADGRILFAIGDNGDAGEDGRVYAQDLTSHLGKLLRIDPITGSWQIVARGLRNVQRLEQVQIGGARYLWFADIGGRVAEELNSIELAAILDPTVIENFGWGRNPVDGRAREGTFYIDAAGFVLGSAPLGEVGFVQPIAQWGREGRRLVAISGPLTLPAGFTNAMSLTADLFSGEVYAATSAGPGAAVERVVLLDASNGDARLADLRGLVPGGGRADPRFFRHPDGSAGVLLEATGDIYRLEQVPCGAAREQIDGVACGLADIEPLGEPLGYGAAGQIRVAGGTPGQLVVVLAEFVRFAPALDLGVFGAPGCEWHLPQPVAIVSGSFDASGSLATSISRAAPSVPCGLGIHFQAVAAQPGSGALGVSTSRVLTWRIGW